MSPKTATLSVALLSLTLTFATANGGCKDSLGDILKSYDVPPILFPKPAEKTFTCTPLNDSAVSIEFTLHSPCKVTRTLYLVKNVLTCARAVSATVSYRRISNIKGVTVRLYVSLPPFPDLPFPFAPQLMTVTDAKIFYDSHHVKSLQFIAKDGNSPVFNLDKNIFPDHPPTCDARHTVLSYSDDDGRPLFPLNVVA